MRKCWLLVAVIVFLIIIINLYLKPPQKNAIVTSSPAEVKLPALQISTSDIAVLTDKEYAAWLASSAEVWTAIKAVLQIVDNPDNYIWEDN